MLRSNALRRCALVLERPGLVGCVLQRRARWKPRPKKQPAFTRTRPANATVGSHKSVQSALGASRELLAATTSAIVPIQEWGACTGGLKCAGSIPCQTQNASYAQCRRGSCLPFSCSAPQLGFPATSDCTMATRTTATSAWCCAARRAREVGLELFRLCACLCRLPAQLGLQPGRAAGELPHGQLHGEWRLQKSTADGAQSCE